jgi:integrase
VARPWKMKPWPYLRKDGRKSWRVGFRNHEGLVRSRAFSEAVQARAWIKDYVAAERRGKESLKRFILDLDAQEANASSAGRPLGKIITLYLAHNRPEDTVGLAPSTYDSYLHVARRHLLISQGASADGDAPPPLAHAAKIAMTPATEFNGPKAPRAFYDELVRARVSSSICQRAWSVLSAVLSWAAASDLAPEIETNGCLLANERRTSQRRSARQGAQGKPSPGQRAGRQGPGVQHWALSAVAVEHVRRQLLKASADRDRILAERDAMMVSLQFGLACRNQEMYALRWSSVSGDSMQLVDVVSWGKLDDGKTAHSTPRGVGIPSLLAEDLDAWRAALEQRGLANGDDDFIVPGDLTGVRYGVSDPRTGGRHFSANQAKRWGPKCLSRAVERVAAEKEEHAGIIGATPYSLRRGGITMRLHAEDPQVVAAECGTSLQMLDRHYSFALEEFRRRGARPVDIVWRDARRKVWGGGRSPRLRVVT